MTVTSRGPHKIALPDGGELTAEEAGAGIPVVLIHGFSFDRSLWDSQFHELIQRHQTIRYDLRGFGSSSAPVSAQGHVEDLLAVLGACTVGRAHLVGLSLGANIALAAAALHPDRVRSVVLASPGLPGYAWTTPRPPDEAAAVARRAGIAAAKQWWLGHEVFRSAERYPAARAHLADMVGRWPAYQWAGGPAAPPLPSLTGYLGTLRSPVLVMNGALDVTGYREIASVLHREIPGARREEFPDAGHLLNLERPARFNDELLSFLA
jgi:pimeloyl-ACP methyl ester carboxylesterase